MTTTTGQQTPPKARRSPRRIVIGIAAWIGIALIAFWTLAPIGVMISTSFKPELEIFAIPPTILPQEWTLANYTRVFTDSSMPNALWNSVLVAVLVTVMTLIFCSTAGYALARFKFRGSRPIALFLLLGQMLPLTVLLLPLYQLVNGMNMLDTVMGLAIVHLVITVPLVTWMIRNQIAAIPIELEEAAMIDGGSRFDAVSYIVLPVAAPGLAAAGMFAFLQSWHEFVLASVITSSTASRTAPVALTEFASEFRVDWGSTMAAAIVLTVPIVIIFIALQKYFVRGLTGGAVKG